MNNKLVTDYSEGALEYCGIRGSHCVGKSITGHLFEMGYEVEFKRIGKVKYAILRPFGDRYCITEMAISVMKDTDAEFQWVQYECGELSAWFRLSD